MATDEYNYWASVLRQVSGKEADTADTFRKCPMCFEVVFLDDPLKVRGSQASVVGHRADCNALRMYLYGPNGVGGPGGGGSVSADSTTYSADSTEITADAS